MISIKFANDDVIYQFRKKDLEHFDYFAYLRDEYNYNYSETIDLSKYPIFNYESMIKAIFNYFELNDTDRDLYDYLCISQDKFSLNCIKSATNFNVKTLKDMIINPELINHDAFKLKCITDPNFIIGNIKELIKLPFSVIEYCITDECKYIPLHAIIECDNLMIIEHFIKFGSNIDRFSRAKHENPIIYAIKKENMDLIELLIKYSADINIIVNGRNMFYYANETGNTKIIETLILNGANIKDTKIFENPIFGAIFTNDPSVVEIYLNYIGNNDIETIRTSDDKTLLMYAIQENKYIIVDYLISKGCLINYKNKYHDSPLLIALKKGYRNIAKLLLSKGANKNIHNHEKLFNTCHEDLVDLI